MMTSLLNAKRTRWNSLNYFDSCDKRIFHVPFVRLGNNLSSMAVKGRLSFVMTLIDPSHLLAFAHTIVVRLV